jgi:competence protein ComEC
MGLLTNILAVPLVGWIVPLGLAALLLALLWPVLGAVVAIVVSVLVGLLLFLVESFSGLGASYGIPPPPLWVALLYVGALVALAVAVAHRRHRRWAGLGLAVLILVVVTHPFSPRLPNDALELTVLDVAQGDALFLAFPNGETWLVDGGRGPVEVRSGYRVGEAIGRTVVVPYLRSRRLKKIDRLWLTHAHHDHMAGLTPVLEEFEVGSFHTGTNPLSSAYEKLLKELGARGIPLHTHGAGERFSVGEVAVEVLWPSGEYTPGPSPSNNDSVVLRLCRAGTCVLLPGDIEPGVEKRLAESDRETNAAVLKVPHHGGRDAAGDDWLSEVRPEVAIISVGATNPFGHPFAPVLNRLTTTTGKVFRTDQDGSVTVRIGEGSFSVRSYYQQQRAEPYANLAAKVAACAGRVLSLESH